MFDFLTDKLQSVTSSLMGKKSLSEDNVKEAVSKVRMALLDADVNYQVIKTFIAHVKEKALGDAVIKSVKPGEQFIKIVHDELIALMGSDEKDVKIKSGLNTFMVCGLQGSGKTTFCAKFAKYLQKDKDVGNILLVACDRQRPGAIEQLRQLSEKINVEIFVDEGEKNALKVAKSALKHIKKEDKYSAVIFDTAGRLHIDKELMEELKSIKKLIQPDEVYFVANAMLGQDAVNVAKQFHDDMEFDATVLTMLDGSTRGGAALSIVEVTKKPLKFEGIGEKIEDLQLFHPQSLADRILGMGDTINLVKRASEHISDEDAQKLEKKLKKASFNYEDFLKQFAMIKKMGSMKGLLKMLPGASMLNDLPFSEEDFMKNEAIILSMTINERKEKDEIIMPRRRRLAKGSGTSIDDVNRLIKNFKRCKQMLKSMPKGNKLQKLMGGF